MTCYNLLSSAELRRNFSPSAKNFQPTTIQVAIMAFDAKMMEIVKEIGCTDGFHIPVANEENRLLEKEIKELLQRKAELIVAEEILDDDVNILNERLTDNTISQTQIQNLILANRKQYETEQHMLKAAERENENLSRNNRNALKTLNSLINERKKSEDELAKTTEHIDKLRSTIEWGEETLLAWNEDLAKRTSEVNILDTYNLEDNNRFKELDFRRQHLQGSVIEREIIVEKEVSDLLQVEREFEQTSKLTRQSQKERDRLLEQWENSSNFFKSHNEELQNSVQEINKIKETIREVYDKMREDKRAYQNYLEENEDIQCELSETHKVNDEMKLTLIKQQEEIENLASEVSIAQGNVNHQSHMLDDERAKRRHMERNVAKMGEQIQQKRHEISDLEESLKKTRSQSMTTEERLNELEKIFDAQKAKADQLMLDGDKLQTASFHAHNEMKQLQSKVDLINRQLSRTQSTQSVSDRDEWKIRQLIMDRKEVVYNLSFQLELICNKVAEAQGSVDLEVMHELQDQLYRLNEELNHATDYRNQLDKQLKATDCETRRLVKELERDTTELSALQERRQHMTNRNEGGVKQIKSLKEQNHHHHMEELMLKFKVAQMKKSMDHECEKMHSLARQREELTADVNKRKAEVAAILDRLNGERKILLEEKSSAKRRLDMVAQQIGQRQKKYQILLASMGTDGSTFTVGEYRIRVSQEKLELQELGDQLDSRVQKLEEEIRAMENTLHVLNATNSCYKASLSSANPESVEYKEKIRLAEICDNVNDMCRQKKINLRDIKSQIQDLEVKCQEANDELVAVTAMRGNRVIELERVLKEVEGQRLKLERVDGLIRCELKKLEKKCVEPDKGKTLEHIKKDIHLRQLKKVNKMALELLAEMSVRHIGLEPTARQYLADKDLTLPTVSGLLLLPSSLKIKSSCGSSVMSLSSGASTSQSDDDRKSKCSVVNVGGAGDSLSGRCRKSGKGYWF
ncbi:coiled-coil domain-containing protein 39-like [Adelges cooleyi]|uniref:coiled-coil domain-containing protein 39-like n=1 Tax=Adelges cooleyi TaxID=133065 RepID=UPI00218079D5|nr:coiled-coil domain-containing protein 39-like [Adelges cooleyi]